MRILLAEDERSLSRAVIALLEKNNYSADAVYDGEEALEYLAAENYDALILDIMMPGMDGLTVLRPGLHLGTVKKGRFEPSHALALAVTPNAIEDLGLWQRCAELWNPAVGNGDALAERWLRGEALAETALARLPRSGWNLMTYRGVPLGWGKVSGGAVKNHYPKGLRWV